MGWVCAGGQWGHDDDADNDIDDDDCNDSDEIIYFFSVKFK